MPDARETTPDMIPLTPSRKVRATEPGSSGHGFSGIRSAAVAPMDLDLIDVSDSGWWAWNGAQWVAHDEAQP